MPIAVERWYAEIEASTETLAGLVHGADLTRQVPTCPEWTLRQLATHVGRAHRWSAEIVSTRSAEFIPFRQVPDGRIPDDPALHAPWLRAGAELLIKSVRQAGGDPGWTGPMPRSPPAASRSSMPTWPRTASTSGSASCRGPRTPPRAWPRCPTARCCTS